jgi:hypothetical protein
VSEYGHCVCSPWRPQIHLILMRYKHATLSATSNHLPTASDIADHTNTSRLMIILVLHR